MFKSLWIRIAAYFAVWTFIALAFGCVSYYTYVGFSWWDVLVISAIRFYIWAALFPFIIKITRRLRFETPRQWLNNLLFHILIGFLLSIAQSLIYTVIYWVFEDPGEVTGFTITQFYLARFFNSLYFGLMIYGLIVIAIHAFLFYQNYREEEKKAALLKTQLARSQLQALQMQLHPHFLFNALHSIESLIFEDPQKASGMVARLGDFLRLTLEHSEDQMVMLGQELEFLRCYLEIEQIRFQDRLTVRIETAPLLLSARVPHLFLQPIVENAIRHGISPRSEPGRIDIAARRVRDSLRVEVKDDGPGMPAEKLPAEKGAPGRARQGRGLPNVRARLEQIYGDSCSMELVNVAEGGLAVIIEIPFEPDSLLRVEAIGNS